MKIICAGDDRAADSLHAYGIGEAILVEKNLPINATKTRSMMAFGYSRYDQIIWSPSFPLVGCRGISMLQRLATLPPKSRFINYEIVGFWKNFDENNYWQALSSLDINFMFAFWDEMLTYIFTEWGNKLVVFPWSVAWWEKQLNLSISALELLNQASARFEVQTINLSALSPEVYSGDPVLAEIEFLALQESNPVLQ